MKFSRSNLRSTKTQPALQRKSLTRKLLSYVLLIGLVPLVFFGAFSILQTNNILTSETIEFQTELVKQRQLNIDHILGDIGSLAANLSGIDEINNALLQGPMSSSFDKLTTQAKIGYILSGYSNLSGLISIDIFSNTDVHYHVGETLNTANKNFSMIKQLYDESTLSQETLSWRGIQSNINLDSKYPLVVMATKSLYANSRRQDGARPDGLLVISYDPKVFEDNFVQTQEGGYSIVMDTHNRIIFHTDQTYIGKTLSSGITANIKNSLGHFRQKIDHKPMFVIYSKTQKGNWTVATFVPISSINEKNIYVTVLFVMLIIFAIAAILYLGTLISKQIVMPIRGIVNTFSALKNGDLENAERLNIKTKDEIGELGHLFNSFIDAHEDITVQKKLERQLNEQNYELQQALEKLKTSQAQILQQEKLAGIGQLAGGVAHEINNPINGIMNYAQLIIDEGMQDSEIAAYATEILSESERVAVIVKSLLQFARQEKQTFKEEQMVEIINQTLALIKTLMRHQQITIEMDAPDDLPSIMCRSQQIQQVLMNLLTNARDALNEKYSGYDVNKVINIQCTTFYKNEAQWLRVVIMDHGNGIPQSIMNRIFEPFYTTKPRDKGTGLGLAISHGIVKDHGGLLYFESEVGQYTKAYLELPVA